MNQRGSCSIILFFIICICPIFALGQIDDLRKTEEEIQLEDKFLASKLYQIAGKQDEAIKLMDSLRKNNPQNAAIYFELAKLHYAKKEYNLVENNLNQALRYGQDNTMVLSFAVEYAITLGRYDEAIEKLKQINALSPKTDRYYDQIVDIQIKQGNFDDAFETLESKEKDLGISEKNTLRKAEMLDKAGKTKAAVDLIHTLTVQNPRNTKYLKLIANILKSNNQAKEALPYLQKILEIDPSDVDAKLGLMVSNTDNLTHDQFLVSLFPLFKASEVSIDLKIKEILPYIRQHALNGDTTLGQKLIELCDVLVITHANEAKAHAAYADVLKNNGHYTHAIRQYEKTLSLNNKNFLVWEQLMFCLLAEENYENLLKTGLQAMDYFPNQAISYYFVSKALIQSGDIKKARSLLEEASLISGGNVEMESRILCAQAETWLLEKKYDQASSSAEQAIKTSGGKSGEAYEVKGDVAFAQKDLTNALIHWDKALRILGKNKRLLRKIQDSKSLK